MRELTTDDVGRTIPPQEWMGERVPVEVVMIIIGASGRKLFLVKPLPEGRYSTLDREEKQGEAIRIFMTREAAWLKLQAETQSSQKTVQS